MGWIQRMDTRRRTTISHPQAVLCPHRGNNSSIARAQASRESAYYTRDIPATCLHARLLVHNANEAPADVLAALGCAARWAGCGAGDGCVVGLLWRVAGWARTSALLERQLLTNRSFANSESQSTWSAAGARPKRVISCGERRSRCTARRLWCAPSQRLCLA